MTTVKEELIKANIDLKTASFQEIERAIISIDQNQEFTLINEYIVTKDNYPTVITTGYNKMGLNIKTTKNVYKYYIISLSNGNIFTRITGEYKKWKSNVIAKGGKVILKK